MDFKNKRALVTGAGRGIGYEIAKRLAECGAQVIAISKAEENLPSLKKQFPSVTTLCVDLSDWNSTRKIVDELGVIDLLVNNAGVAFQDTFENITEEALDIMFSVNVKSAINVSQVVVKNLKKHKKRGAIVNVSSVAALISSPSLTAYATTKSAIDRLTKNMAVEYGPYGIRVNAVNPTFVNTAMAASILPDKESQGNAMKQIPLGCFCEVEDVTEPVLFLLSDKARMINGVILPIDGGQSAK